MHVHVGGRSQNLLREDRPFLFLFSSHFDRRAEDEGDSDVGRAAGLRKIKVTLPEFRRNSVAKKKGDGLRIVLLNSRKTDVSFRRFHGDGTATSAAAPVVAVFNRKLRRFLENFYSDTSEKKN